MVAMNTRGGADVIESRETALFPNRAMVEVRHALRGCGSRESSFHMLQLLVGETIS